MSALAQSFRSLNLGKLASAGDKLTMPTSLVDVGLELGAHGVIGLANKAYPDLPVPVDFAVGGAAALGMLVASGKTSRVCRDIAMGAAHASIARMTHTRIEVGPDGKFTFT